MYTIENINGEERIQRDGKDIWVECQVCKSQLKNWVGSTPCCGSIAWVVEGSQSIVIPGGYVTVYGNVSPELMESLKAVAEAAIKAGEKGEIK